MLVAATQLLRGRELAHGEGRGGLSGEVVVLDELMAVGREHEADVEPLALGIAFRLVKAKPRGQAFLFCLDQGQGDGLGVCVDLDPEHVVDLAALAATTDGLNGPGRLLAPDEVFGPAALVNGWVDELGSGIGFVEAHLCCSNSALSCSLRSGLP